MTTGTKVDGGFAAYPGDSSTVAVIGRKTTKTWNGNNSPPGTRTENPYTMTKVSEGYIAVKYERMNAQGKSFVPPVIKKDASSYLYGRPAPPPDLWSSNDDIILFNKLAGKVRTHEFNAGAFLGEGHQTLSMIGENARNIAQSLRNVRKGNFKRAISLLTGVPDPSVPHGMRYKKLAQNMSHNWLMLQYGWLPLLGDVHSGAEALAAQFNKPISNTYRAQHSRSNTKSVIQSTSHSVVGSFTRTKRVKVTMQADESTVASLGLTDPFTIAWELVPWSFVIDWFVPIGPWLEASGKMRSMRFKSVVTTNFAVSNATVVNGGTYFNGYKPLSEAPSNEYRVVSLRRTVAPTYPSLPIPSVKPLSDALSFRHAINGIALLAGLIR